MSAERLLFVNVGWQNKYKGPKADDPTLGGHGYLRKHKMGHEAWNFAPLRGRIHGYVPRETTIRLERLGGRKSDETIDDVTVVWIARHPSTGRTVIVGWYESALVRRRSGAVEIPRPGGFRLHTQVEADASTGRLLPVDQRTFVIPTAKEKGNLGQSPVWYGTDESFRNRVREFIRNDGRDGAHRPRSKRGAGRQSDPAARKLIEVEAVRIATRYYESIEGGERVVTSVEREARGWDLDVSGRGETLKVEVKGVSGSIPSVEVTPNEYKAMCASEHRREYVIFIVTGVGSPSPKKHIFRFDEPASTRHRAVWISQEGRTLRIEPRMAARLIG